MYSIESLLSYWGNDKLWSHMCQSLQNIMQHFLDKIHPLWNRSSAWDVKHILFSGDIGELVNLTLLYVAF